MDPIKVDFKSKGHSKEKEIVIPPEKSGLKIAIGVILTIVTAAIAYYVMLPALNFKDTSLYIYIALIAVSYVVWQAVLSKAITKPEYTPYVKKRATIPGIILGIVVIIGAIGWLVGCVFFRAKSYSKIISVDTDTSFADGINEETEDTILSIPRLDETAASQVATRALSDLTNVDGKNYVSQFTVSASNYQINYKDAAVRIVPLQYANIIKWLTNTSDGIPGYVIVNMADANKDIGEAESGKFVKCPEGNIRYSTAEHFGKLVKRQLRFKYPTYLFDEATFEVDEAGKPYWICARLDKTIGLFGGTDVLGAVVMDAVTGECTYYSIDDLKNKEELSWIDRVYSSNLIVEQFNYHGKYSGGFWNSLLGQKEVVQTTSGYSYIAMDNDVWMYSGVSSVTSDESITGFILVNQRTKEARFFSVAGGTESSAQGVAEGRVADLGYTATFPILINIGGEPTYFMSLKDSNDVVHQYALINVKNYNNTKWGANGEDVATCVKNYVDILDKNHIEAAIDTDKIPDGNDENTNPDGKKDNETEKPDDTQPVSGTVTGTVTDIRTAVKDGESWYYIQISGSTVYYAISASQDESVVILNKGDSVTITAEGEGKIVNAKSIKIN